MHWRLHPLVLDERIEEATDIVSGFGDTFTVLPLHASCYNPYKKSKHRKEALLSITTIEDAVKNPGLGVPHLYYHKTKYNVSSWMPFTKLCLNHDTIFMPFGMLNRLPMHFCGKVFIRPDSGNKTFTGFVVDVDDAAEQLEYYNNFSINKNIMCAVASAKELPEYEFRFWIVGKKIVTYSSYSHNQKDSRQPSKDMIKFISEYVTEIEQPDVSYVVDAVCSNGNNFIVEMNATSTSGVYQCDLNALFKALRDVAIREFNGEVFL